MYIFDSSFELSFHFFYLTIFLKRVFFDHAVFHPLIESQSPFELDVRRGPLKKWRRNVNHIWQILLYTRRAFYKIDTSEPLNQEAADL